MTNHADDPSGGDQRRVSDVQSLAVDSQRRARPALDPKTWESLLELSIALSADITATEAANAVVTSLADLLPNYAVGVCLADERAGTQISRRQLPDAWSKAPGRDPTRLFPESGDERILAIDRAGGSTLHLAGDQLPEAGAPCWAALEYVRRCLERMLGRQQVAERTRRDAAGLRALQAQVIQAEKLASLGQIAAGIVHELNNPLTSIIAYAEFLRRNAKTREDVDAVERLARIQEAAERILRFSRDLVSYARPATDVPGPVDLCEVLDKAVVFCEHEFAERGVRPQMLGRRPGLLVRGVAGQLTQVFVNLLTNAAHSMRGRGGVLEISWALEPDGESVAVRVKDEGEGISAEDLDKIFEPFFTTKSPGEGTGLGLSIVLGIVEGHGGRMFAESVQGQGTTFHVVLPLAPNPSSRPPQP